MSHAHATRISALAVHAVEKSPQKKFVFTRRALFNAESP